MGETRFLKSGGPKLSCAEDRWLWGLDQRPTTTLLLARAFWNKLPGTPIRLALFVLWGGWGTGLFFFFSFLWDGWGFGGGKRNYDVTVGLGGSFGELAVDPLSVILANEMGKEKEGFGAFAKKGFKERDDGRRERGHRVLEQQLLGQVLPLLGYAYGGRRGGDPKASQKVD